jgi:DNA modification methylase
MSVFHSGDVFNILNKRIPSKSISLIYIDPPFGTTHNFWDETLDWKKLFGEMFRVLKNDGMIVIHCSIPFNYKLIREAPTPPSHSWYWLKESHTNPMLSKIQPLRQMEEILVWKNKKPVYYPQKIGDELNISTYMTTSSYFGKDTKGAITYNKGKFRTHYISMKRNIDGFSTRPDELVKLMIDSYSKEGDTILDLFCYNGLSYKCKGNRRWIGIDKYFIPKFVVN